MHLLKHFYILLFLPMAIWAQPLTGPKLLEKSIRYHDPNGNWEHFKGEFTVTMKSAKGSDRVSNIFMDFDRQAFSVAVAKDGDAYTYDLVKDSCSIRFNGSSTIAQETKERLRLSCERAFMYKDYYTYLYGLPMKLSDPGTQIHETVEERSFQGKTYLRLKVTYEKEVGKDTWYFYFDPRTYAMEGYQFYHDETKNDGEYIVLKDLTIINGIKMPKIREWYFNKDDAYLGTDILGD